MFENVLSAYFFLLSYLTTYSILGSSHNWKGIFLFSLFDFELYIYTKLLPNINNLKTDAEKSEFIAQLIRLLISSSISLYLFSIFSAFCILQKFFGYTIYSQTKTYVLLAVQFIVFLNSAINSSNLRLLLYLFELVLISCAVHVYEYKASILSLYIFLVHAQFMALLCGSFISLEEFVQEYLVPVLYEGHMAVISYALVYVGEKLFKFIYRKSLRFVGRANRLGVVNQALYCFYYGAKYEIFHNFLLGVLIGLPFIGREISKRMFGQVPVLIEAAFVYDLSIPISYILSMGCSDVRYQSVKFNNVMNRFPICLGLILILG